MTAEQPALPLEGIRVVDFTQVFAGPACTRVLADLGAEVIKIESVNRLDITRSLIITDNDGLDHPWNRGSYFVIRNTGKKGITLDLNQPQGVDIARRLIATADIVAESFTPRVMRNFGLHYEALCEIKPDIIMLSMSGYGQQGPYMDWGAYGMGLEPASGISRLTGYRDGGPLRSGLSFTDPLSGFVAAGAVLAALHYRRRTGKGQYIDLSEQEAAIPLIGAHIMEYVMTGRLPRRMGNRSEYAAPQGCYPCRGEDSWIVISVESDDEWSALCRATGHAEWEDDERFADVLSRHRHHDEIDRLLSEWTSQHDHLEAMRLLQAAGVKAAAVLDGKEILFDPHFRARHHFDLVDQPLLGKRWVQRHVIAKFSDFEAETRSHAPLLGEHNRDVLIGELGLSEEEYQALEDGHVLGTEPDMVVPPQVLSAALKLPYDKYVEHGIIRTIDRDYQQQLGLE